MAQKSQLNNGDKTYPPGAITDTVESLAFPHMHVPAVLRFKWIMIGSASRGHGRGYGRRTDSLLLLSEETSPHPESRAFSPETKIFNSLLLHRTLSQAKSIHYASRTLSVPLLVPLGDLGQVLVHLLVPQQLEPAVSRRDPDLNVARLEIL